MKNKGELSVSTEFWVIEVGVWEGGYKPAAGPTEGSGEGGGVEGGD